MTDNSDLDTAIEGIIQQLNLDKYIMPVNLEDARDRFFQGAENPGFEYVPTANSHPGAQIQETLGRLEVPDDHPFAEAYRRVISNLDVMNRMIAVVGDNDAFTALSLTLYDQPSNEVIAEAERRIATSEHAEREEINDAKYVRQVIVNELQQYNLEDWRVQLSPKWRTSVYGIMQPPLVTICEDRRFSESDISKMLIRAIQTDVLQTHNGSKQPYGIFRFGFPGHELTSEGMAINFGAQMEIFDDLDFADYAGRVLAVDCAADQQPFRVAFERLKDYGVSDEDAWQHCVRAYRGGGYTRDHIYLSGFMQVDEWLSEDNNAMWLYLGRVDLDHIGDSISLANTTQLQMPSLLPAFFNSDTD